MAEINYNVKVSRIATYSELNTTDKTLIGSINELNNKPIPTKSQIGLGNVDNTSDLNKPISTATQTSLDTKQNISDMTNYYLKSQTYNSGQIDSFLVAKANQTSLDTTNTNVTNLTNQINNLRITQNFSTQTSSITVGVLGGQGTYLIKGNLQFKKGNNIYTLCSINTTPVNSFTAQLQNTFGTTWRAYLDTASSTTSGTNITATYTNGTKSVNAVDGYTVTFPNTNTVVVTARDNSTTPCTISFDVSGLA